MKVLHLFGDWKWTGPAEPTLDLCVELRALGVEVTLACQSPPPEASSNLPAKVRERGLEPDFAFALNRKFNVGDNIADIARVRERCDRDDIDILHVHFTHDHIIGALGARMARHRPLVVRTNHKGAPLPWLLRSWTDAYLTFSRADLEQAALDAPKLLISPGMRLDRFNASPPREDRRAHFGISKDTFVVGVVARMQRHRRFEVLLEGIQRARRHVPDLRILVVGRGTNMQEVAVEPAKRLGLEGTVLFTGYLGGAYLDTVAAFDALLFLVPGSDGTCRALREAMAMGKAAIGARRGMIPEIIDDGWTGFVVDDTPQNIADAIERLAGDRTLCVEMGRRAREKALAVYDIRRQAQEVLKFYKSVLKRTESARR
ncbi:MAG: glycosyltransferase family 4 protein [Planctomycetes bacterium]|nr:glycosyltransferase family 4 protein [Planctomycetota bacterium]